MLEVWKSVDGYNDWYEVSNLGRVRSIDRYVTYSDGRVQFYHGQYLKSSIQLSGYCTVGLRTRSSRKTVSVHRLAAKAFIPNPENKREVNHMNGDKADNRVENLEWVTTKENQRHARLCGLDRPDTNPQCRRIRCIETGEIFYSVHECARRFNVSDATIYDRMKIPERHNRVISNVHFEFV